MKQWESTDQRSTESRLPWRTVKTRVFHQHFFGVSGAPSVRIPRCITRYPCNIHAGGNLLLDPKCVRISRCHPFSWLGIPLIISQCRLDLRVKMKRRLHDREREAKLSEATGCSMSRCSVIEETFLNRLLENKTLGSMSA